MAVPEPIETFLQRLGFDFSVLHAGRDDALKQARGHREVVDTLVLVADHTPVLATVRAGDRVDLERVRQAAGAQSIRPATGDELASFYPDVDAGAVPPLGPLYGHPVFVDEAVARSEHVAFPAGTTNDVIRMRYRDFVALVHPTVVRVARPS